MKDRHAIWLEKFPTRLDPPPYGWFRYLNSGWMPKSEWFPRYKLYLRSTAWLNRRRGVLNRAEGKCQLCAGTERLEVHHVTYARVGAERIEDLRCLCHVCHRGLDKAAGNWVPLDRATREEVARRKELRARKEAAKRVTRRRPGGVRV